MLLARQAPATSRSASHWLLAPLPAAGAGPLQLGCRPAGCRGGVTTGAARGEVERRLVLMGTGGASTQAPGAVEAAHGWRCS